MITNLRAHYGFARMPFGRDLAPGMLHRHDSHSQAAARIIWCIQERTLGLVTGEVGAGKTAALRAAFAGLDPSRHILIYVSDPTVGVRGIYSAVVAGLGGVPRPHHATLVPQALDAIAHEQAERGRTPILAIDEAHMLQPPVLEAVRMLLNHDLDSASHMACLLIGQPKLRRNVKLGTLAALDQRIAMRYVMEPMNVKETTSYLHHHVKLAGRSDTLFADDAIELIHTVSRGLPRAANNLALQSLLAAFAERKAIVDHASARIAVNETTTE
jgi:type II secretory pathway predicted ATPase ExeA